jgi:hypothetical protein
MNLYRTRSLQFVDANPIFVLLVSLLLPILIKHLSDFLREDIALLERSTTIANKGEIHVEEGWILFHKQGINENYRWNLLE